MKRVVTAIIILLLLLSSGAAINKFKQNDPTLSADTKMRLTDNEVATVIDHPKTVNNTAVQAKGVRKHSASVVDTQQNQINSAPKTVANTETKEPTPSAVNNTIETSDIAATTNVVRGANVNASYTKQPNIKTIAPETSQESTPVPLNTPLHNDSVEQLDDSLVKTALVEQLYVDKEQPLTVKLDLLNLSPPMPPGTLGGGNGNGGPGAGQQSVSSN
ncbi:hypothetical protein RI845_05640 [Thalassotalea nanhaiensis]|uniref:Uncharacterized protein n=1 Tax=Thalassotalea nanhaiensis TaxID=3065648 RepID=A0ABY9TLP1_9GAMM|nr:hypothetical protein RI845_05640 [Colwelliaceae bacterium SQ345]